MAERDRLDSLAKWQRRIAKDPAVQAVIGPEQVADRTEPLKNTGNELRTSNEKGGDLYELNKLGPQLARASNGVSQIRNGLARAASGAGLLAKAPDNAEEGALQIADGLGEAIEGGARAVAGTERLDEGAKEVEDGATRLAEGQEEAELGANRTSCADQVARCELRTQALKRANSLERELKPKQPRVRSSRKRPKTPAVVAGVIEGLQERAADSRSKAGELDAGEVKLFNGGIDLREGAAELHDGTSEFREETPALPSGLEELQDGHLPPRQRDIEAPGRLRRARSEARRRLPPLLSASGRAAAGQCQGDQRRRLDEQTGRPDQRRVARSLRLRLLRPLGDRRRAAGRP